MAFQDDWILRQVESLVHFVTRLLFQKDTITYTLEEKEVYTDTDLVYIKLRERLKAGDLCGAEDLLFEEYRAGDDYIRLGLDFYTQLNALDDLALESGDFSREEIEEGLRAFLKKADIGILEEK